LRGWNGVTFCILLVSQDAARICVHSASLLKLKASRHPSIPANRSRSRSTSPLIHSFIHSFIQVCLIHRIDYPIPIRTEPVASIRQIPYRSQPHPPPQSIMCKRVDCSKCGKPTWAGCGQHIEQALAGVPPEQRCQCPREQGSCTTQQQQQQSQAQQAK